MTSSSSLKAADTVSVGQNLRLLFLLAVVGILLAAGDSENLRNLALIFASIVLEAMPFMLLGSLVGGLIEVFLSRDRLIDLLPRRRWLTPFFSAAMGLVFPVCECGIVPVVRRLAGKGMPLSGSIAYLLAGPLVNPLVGLSTAFAYAGDMQMVWVRLGVGYLIAVSIALLLAACVRDEDAYLEDGTRQTEKHPQGNSSDCHHDHASTEHKACCHHHHADPIHDAGRDQGLVPGTRWRSVFRHSADDFFAVAHYLIIGAFLAALAQTLIDRSFFAELSSHPFLAILVFMVLAILLNLCSEADAFIAASFRNIIPLSAQMSFLLTGPMFDLKLLLMYQAVFRPRFIRLLAASIIAIVLLASLLIQYLGVLPS